MKKTLAIFCSLFFYFLFSVTAQNYKWVRGGGTTASMSSSFHNEGSYYTCTDPHGNVYSLNIVGNSPIYADTFYRSSAYGAATNILVTSYNCSGQMRWAKLIGSANNLNLYGMTVDSFGHVYIAANYVHLGGSQIMYIGYDTSFSANPYLSAGVIQLDTNGDFNWIRYIGQSTSAGLYGTSPGYGAIALDKQQNLHFIKLFRAGSQITSTLTSVYGTYDLTYNPAGNLINIHRLALDSTLTVYGATIDTSNNKLYVHGYVNTLLSYTYNTNFVASYDTLRNLIWKDTIITPLTAGGFSGIGTDNDGHIYLSGVSGGSVVYQNDTFVNVIASGYGISFILKIDTASHPVWLRGYSSTTSIGDFNTFTMMPNGKLAAAGTMAGMIVADHDTITSYSGEGQNSFFTILDTSGAVHTIQQIHGSGFYDAATSIASDRVGNLYIGGQVVSNVWGDTIAHYNSVGGNTDFYVLKYGLDCSCTSMPIASYVDTNSLSATGGGDTVRFGYTGPTSGIDSVRWSFGDGTTSNLTNPTHIYSTIGTYHACVRIYSYCGNDVHCTDITIPCITAPGSSFTSTGISASRNFTYTGTTIGLDSVAWAFGDSGHATGLTTAHTYTAIGTYIVCATAYNLCGNNTSCNTITVPCVSLPAANYTSTGSGATRNFTYTGTTTAIDSIAWRFGDGGRATGTTTSHTYGGTGTFTACVIAYNHCGNDTQCYNITIPCVAAPVAAYTHSGVTTIGFLYSGTAVGLDSVVWTFGDGSHATGATTTSHTYSAVGTYTACVTAYNPCGNNSACATITIPCIAPPIASFTTTGTAPVNFAYSGTTVALDSVVWNFGDGNHAIGLTTTHAYALPDTYLVCVTAYNPCGWDSACYTVIIPCDTPVAAFTHTGMLPANFTYTGTTTHIDSVTWQFGDGTTATGNTTTHSYAVSGTYHVCVIAYTNCAMDSACSDIFFTGLGVGAVTLHSIQVYPNPVTDELIITGIMQLTPYRLLNVTGISLQAGILEKGSNALSLKNYAPGVYVLEITATDGSKEMVKVVKA